jgi:signal transduction histidine kinase
MYIRNSFGPVWQFSLLVSYVGIGVALYYLLELSVTSQHRSSRPVAVYAVGIGLSLVPSMLTAAGQVPTLPGYDHSVFGLAGASIAFLLGAWLGMVKLSPISRDRLLATTEDGLVVVDSAGEIADHNAVARRFFTDAAPIGRSLFEAAPSVADALPEGGLEAATGHTSDGDAIELTHAVDGEQRVYSMDVSSVSDVDTVHGYALLLREVTERHENRAELRRQNEQLDDFASSIAHHLRNPLQVASGQTEMARRELADGPRDARERVDDLERSLERMETIITDLRTLAKQGKSVESTEFVRFGDVVDEAGAHVDAGGWTLTVERDGTIRADQGRLLSILENLVRNSVEHAGPAVGMSAELTDDGFVFRDDGPGIDADRDRLFEYGYTTSSEGTGLGLSIVKTMAESHGWEVRVDHDHDGARFVVTGAVTDPEPPKARQ